MPEAGPVVRHHGPFYMCACVCAGIDINVCMKVIGQDSEYGVGECCFQD